jgi:hypothetical protein
MSSWYLRFENGYDVPCMLVEGIIEYREANFCELELFVHRQALQSLSFAGTVTVW